MDDIEGRIRILFVIGSLGCGGAERVAVDIASKIDHETFSIDFLIQSGADEFYHDEVLATGASIFHSPKFNPVTILEYRKWLKKFLSNSNYDIVHFHQNTMVTSVAGMLKKRGIKIISHAHSSSFRGSKIAKLCKKALIIGLPRCADVCIGCSDKASEFFYGKNWRVMNNCIVIPNAINTSCFIFSKESRISVRSRYGLTETDFVVGHVGSFTEPKNHIFLVEVFSALQSKNCNSYLLLVGDGPLRGELENRAKELGCLDKIIFVGRVKNPEAYYCAMDVFVFPSIYEGLPLAVVEAQVSGLFCIISSSITENVIINKKQVFSIPISDSNQWKNKLESLIGRPRNIIYRDVIASSKWGMEGFVGQFERIYNSLVELSIPK